MGDKVSFFKGIAIIIALYCIVLIVFKSGSPLTNNDIQSTDVASENTLIQQIDLGELASFEVIPDVALNAILNENNNASVSLSAASVLPDIASTAQNISNKLQQVNKVKVESINKNEEHKETISNTNKQQQNKIEPVTTAPINETISTPTPTSKSAPKKKETTQPQLPKYHFSTETFDLNQYDVSAGKIKKGQVIGKILNKHKVDHLQIVKLSKKSKKVHDVRDINYGKKYMVLTNKYADDVADYFLYEPDDYHYVVYDLNGDTEVTEVTRTIEKRLAEASGEIKTSLYQTMIDNDLNPELTYQISEVYAWTVDFYRINSGDKFKVIYEEEFINGKSVGVGAIKAAWFEYDGTGFYSFQYKQDNLFDYYDTEGNSLRKQFLKAPLRYNRISSRFTRKRYHPVLKRNKSHLGTDYAAPTGTPIHSVGDGKVVESRYGKYNGRYVKIRHNGIYSTQYLHMSKIEPGIKTGAEVKQGDVIGYVGSSGLASGPHLCFRFWKNGRQVDPFKQALPPSKPVDKANKADYLTVVNKWKPLLDNMLVNGEPVADVSSKNTTQQVN